ncbi:MAG TPA: hypothetical protein VHY22_04990 [Chthoniobacteraceae bacterium]|nr:hypothetical protein [Chthoniobacteraceae bacterium]
MGFLEGNWGKQRPQLREPRTALVEKGDRTDWSDYPPKGSEPALTKGSKTTGQVENLEDAQENLQHAMKEIAHELKEQNERPPTPTPISSP